jgi:hypothetical protein
MSQENHIEAPVVAQEEASNGVFTPPNAEKEGKITSTIGTGDNAKNSLIYLTIKWAFWGGIVISVFVIVNSWIFRENEKVPDLLSDLVAWWQIILPLITLALGYAFGKNDTRK